MQPLAVGQTAHSAFPSMTREPSGVLRLVFRQGSDHYLARDGRIMTAESWDDGANWGNPQTLRIPPHDYRDPSIASIGGISYLTWFGGHASNSGLGAAVQRNWWDFSRRIDALAIGAISAPVVKLPDGWMGVPYYGKASGETLDTAWIGRSNDGAWLWSPSRVVDLRGSGLAAPEPYLVVHGQMTHMLYRWGSDGIGIRSSWGSGKPGTWNAPRKILGNATGRPTTIATSNGRLVMVYREASAKNARLAYSTDNGANWHKGDTVLAAPAGSPHGMTYAAMVEKKQPGDAGTELVLVVGMEQADGSSDLWGGTVTVP